MPKPTCLVVYFTRSANTRRVADALARWLGADIEEIRDRANRRGIGGYLRSAFEATLGRLTTLEAGGRDPAAYDLVLVGTPVWNTSLSSPVRSWLVREDGRIRNVAFFCTLGGAGAERVFGQMADVSGLQPVGRLAVRESEVRGGTFDPAIQRFAEQVLSAPLPRPSEPVPLPPIDGSRF